MGTAIRVFNSRNEETVTRKKLVPPLNVYFCVSISVRKSAVIVSGGGGDGKVHEGTSLTPDKFL